MSAVHCHPRTLQLALQIQQHQLEGLDQHIFQFTKEYESHLANAAPSSQREAGADGLQAKMNAAFEKLVKQELQKLIDASEAAQRSQQQKQQNEFFANVNSQLKLSQEPAVENLIPQQAENAEKKEEAAEKKNETPEDQQPQTTVLLQHAGMDLENEDVVRNLCNNDDLQAHQDFAIQQISAEAAAGAAVAGAKVIWDAAKFVAPKVVELLQKLHHHPAQSPPISIKWKQVELEAMKASQYALTAVVVAALIWQRYYPSSQASTVIAIGGALLGLYSTKKGNSLAKDISNVKIQSKAELAGNEGLKLGLAALNPQAASLAGIYLPTEADSADEAPKRRWCQWLAMPSCCSFKACKGLFKRERTLKDLALEETLQT